MATNNMAMILLAGGAAIIGATFLLKPKDDEPTPRPRTGLTAQQILAAEQLEEKEQERDASERRGGGGDVIGQVAAGPVMVVMDEPRLIRVTGV